MKFRSAHIYIYAFLIFSGCGLKGSAVAVAVARNGVDAKAVDAVAKAAGAQSVLQLKGLFGIPVARIEFDPAGALKSFLPDIAEQSTARAGGAATKAAENFFAACTKGSSAGMNHLTDQATGNLGKLANAASQHGGGLIDEVGKRAIALMGPATKEASSNMGVLARSVQEHGGEVVEGLGKRAIALGDPLANQLNKNMGELVQGAAANGSEFVQKLSKTVLEQAATATQEANKHMGALSDAAGKNLKNLGEAAGQAVVPVRNQFIKGTVGVVGAITVAALVIYAGRKYMRKYLYRPALVEESSPGFWRRLFVWSRQSQPFRLEDHMVIDERLAKDLNYLVKMTQNVKKNGGTFENVLLFGKPGTGKTLSIKLIAKNCNMDYMIIPAANVSQFLANGTAVEELNNLFATAAASRRGTIIVFDECETYLADRKTLDARAQEALGIFLSKTGTPSNKIMIAGTTNRPEALDPAVLSRFGKPIEFPLPDQTARYNQIIMHVRDTFAQQKGTVVAYDYLNVPENIKSMAARLEGCSGRALQKGINRLRQLALAEDTLTITAELVDRVIEQLQKEQAVGKK
ncbi:MAG TPA: AAA family ATPase [Candidatus Limnocylindria bacterium]|nr:AAA family ATPase [Candidatus Limnocylindria bacterium]